MTYTEKKQLEQIGVYLSDVQGIIYRAKTLGYETLEDAVKDILNLRTEIAVLKAQIALYERITEPRMPSYSNPRFAGVDPSSLAYDKAQAAEPEPGTLAYEALHYGKPRYNGGRCKC